ARLVNTLRAPVFEDAEKTHRAYLLNIVLCGLVLMPLPYVLYALIEAPGDAPKVMVQSGVAEAINFLLLFWLRRGYVRSASVLQVTALWLFFTVVAATGGGAAGQAYLLGYPLAIAIAGILLGGGGAMAVTAASLTAGFVMLHAARAGSHAFPDPHDPLASWVLSLAFFPMSAVLQYLGARSVRKALETARASEERYRLISRVSSDYTFSTEVDAAGAMKLNWVAGAFEAMTGYGYDEYVAAGAWRAHLHPDDVEKDAQDLRALHSRQDVVSEVRTYRRDREVRWVRVYAHPVWDDAANRLRGIFGAVQDVTPRKHAEVEREAAITELKHKNAELEQFTYTVSHDLKSPLVTVAGFLGHLERDALAGDKHKISEDAGRIRQAVTKMQALLEDLLELSRIGRIMHPSQGVPFGDIARDAVELVRGRLEQRKVRVEIQQALPAVHGDRVRLVEVVQNLVDNAAKFMGKGPDPRIEIGSRGQDAEGHAILFVRDNGIGIAPEFHDRVFGLFDKLDPETEGTGIGLALVRRIVEAHGGRVWLESRAGEGASFCFTLPLASTEPARQKLSATS
ncbi:MAG: ATP-binding protein, partial [Vicinamibacteria bacterium]